MIKKAIRSLMVVAILAVSSIAIAENLDPKLFYGRWAGKWVSDAKSDTAPMAAIITVDVDTRIATIVMFQVVKPPAPAYSSMSIGKIEDDGRIVIDAASSGIEGGGSEMVFWLESPLVIKGKYKNQYESGTFEFKRVSKQDV
ncbi:MAG: hypothetical protein HY445_00320 [Candidatus Niyogibacteria bacterium]|nr:hypothetical protein [Candidatus Niyogibacteria bacterium]